MPNLLLPRLFFRHDDQSWLSPPLLYSRTSSCCWRLLNTSLLWSCERLNVTSSRAHLLWLHCFVHRLQALPPSCRQKQRAASFDNVWLVAWICRTQPKQEPSHLAASNRTQNRAVSERDPLLLQSWVQKQSAGDCSTHYWPNAGKYIICTFKR